MSPQAIERDIFYRWHVSYHGTKPVDLCPILECGRLIKPGIRYAYQYFFFFASSNYVLVGTRAMILDILPLGDKAPDGSLRSPGEGRWNKETAPDGHNVDQLFFSPTPAYSELYAEEDK